MGGRSHVRRDISYNRESESYVLRLKKQLSVRYTTERKTILMAIYRHVELTLYLLQYLKKKLSVQQVVENRVDIMANPHMTGTWLVRNKVYIKSRGLPFVSNGHSLRLTECASIC